MRTPSLLLLALALIGAGGGLAWFVQTDGGRIRMVDVRIPGPDGIFQHGRLFIPPGASAESPAPGIVAIHGYINSNETQSGFVIEFARRGYVVLAVDQPGHGYSDPPSGANGFGGPPALAFLRSLDIVDPGNIGLEGHSMGGWASLAAAAANPEGYRAIVLQGSGPLGAAGAGARNVAVVFSRYDEFSALMWGVPVASEARQGDRMRAFFGTEEPVEPGRIYGSIDQGTARVLHQPPVTHPGNHLSRQAIGHAVDWFEQTLEGGDPLPSGRQVWYWKELGTLLALFGMVLLLFPVGAMLLARPWFAELVEPPVPPSGQAGVGWWGAAVVFALLPALTLFPFKDLPGSWGLSTSALLPQNLTTQVATWAVLVGIISLLLFVAWHLVGRRGASPVADRYGLTWGGRVELRRVWKSWVLAVLVVLAAYATLAASVALFGSDYRFWVFGVKPMNLLHLRIALVYLIPFTLFFVILSTVLHGQMRGREVGLRREILTNILLLTGGFAALLAYQYVPLFAGGTLAISGEPLWTIVAFQFLPLMTIVGAVSTWFHRQTGRVYAGAFTSALLVTWIVVASQATHFRF